MAKDPPVATQATSPGLGREAAKTRPSGHGHRWSGMTWQFRARLHGQQGKLAVGVHGFPDDATTYDHLADALVRAGHRVAAVRPRGEKHLGSAAMFAQAPGKPARRLRLLLVPRCYTSTGRSTTCGRAFRSTVLHRCASGDHRSALLLAAELPLSVGGRRVSRRTPDRFSTRAGTAGQRGLREPRGAAQPRSVVGSDTTAAAADGAWTRPSRAQPGGV